MSIWFDDPAPVKSEGRLVDISASGFRMVHERRSIGAGQVVEFSHLEAAGRSRVVWNRILEGRVESGFVVIALGPRRRNSGR